MQRERQPKWQAVNGDLGEKLTPIEEHPRAIGMLAPGSRQMLSQLRAMFRGGHPDAEERRREQKDEAFGSKLWKPLRRMYRQHLYYQTLPNDLRERVEGETVSVMNVSTNFFCKKAQPGALIERGEGDFGRPCAECIAEHDQVGSTVKVDKLKKLMTRLKEDRGLQVVTFVAGGEPLEKEGYRKTVFELIKHADKLGLDSVVYTGGHTFDDEAVSFLKEHKANVLLSTYGLPFLKPDIFSEVKGVGEYSEKKTAPDGRPLMASQKDMARMVKSWLSMKVADADQTNLAVSAVYTPRHKAHPEEHRRLRRLVEGAQQNDIATYVWEEYVRGMSKDQRGLLESSARNLSGFLELGSLYQWNQCLFGTRSAVTILGDGTVTHCPHTTHGVADLHLDKIIGDDGAVRRDGMAALTKQAHRYEKTSCIVRGTRLGGRHAAIVPMSRILGRQGLTGFVGTASQEFPLAERMWREETGERLPLADAICDHLDAAFPKTALWWNALRGAGASIGGQREGIPQVSPSLSDSAAIHAVNDAFAKLERNELGSGSVTPAESLINLYDSLPPKNRGFLAAKTRAILSDPTVPEATLKNISPFIQDLSGQEVSLSSALRYMHDAERFYDRQVAAGRGEIKHYFHDAEDRLLETPDVMDSVTATLQGGTVALVGLGDREDTIVDNLDPKNTRLVLVDVRYDILTEKAKLYRKKGFTVTPLRMLFEDLASDDAVDAIGKASGASEKLSFVMLGNAVGNLPQAGIWGGFQRYAAGGREVNVLADVQVVDPSRRSEEENRIADMYGSEKFAQFAFKPVTKELGASIVAANGDAEKVPLVSSERLSFDQTVEGGLGGIVGRIRFDQPARFRNIFGPDLRVPATGLEVYRSLKPDAVHYQNFVRCLLGPDRTRAEMLGREADVALYRVGINS